MTALVMCVELKRPVDEDLAVVDAINVAVGERVGTRL